MGLKPVPLVAVALLGVGNLLHIVGLATPEWTTVSTSRGDATSGLWELCLDDDCESIDDDAKEDWLKACEAMAILGMLAGVVALAAAGYVCFLAFRGDDSPRGPASASAGFGALSAVFILICVIIYGAEQEIGSDGVKAGYSFGLSIAGAVLILGGGLAGLKNRNG